MRNNYYYQTIVLDQFTPVSIYERLKTIYKDEIMFLFESVLNSNDGNFSYVVIGDKERVWQKDDIAYFKDEFGKTTKLSVDGFGFLKDYYKKLDKQYYKKISQDVGLGFIDGFIGNIGYDMVKYFEPKLKKHMNGLKDEINEPDLDLIRPKIIVGFSHKTSKLTICTSMREKKDEIKQCLEKLKLNYSYTPLKKAKIILNGKFALTKKQFFDIVKKAKQKIVDGDIFQILITNRWTMKAVVDNLSFYRVLRSKNPSPYLYLLEYENYCIAGSSPEVMVRLKDGKITIRPIAGTRKRGKDEAEDRLMEHDLLDDPKERAEHIMLVDLGRNDVGKVAKEGTVSVDDFMRVERYSHVMHIVSDISATISDDFDMFDLFSATFTAGTMTGAPKIRAMELIADFEKLKRGFYSGSIGYFGFDGNMDTAITIRTSLIKGDMIIFQAGAGIVADSVDKLEYLEVANKLAANINTIRDLTKIE